jgi:N-acetylmuramate 1-kinase
LPAIGIQISEEARQAWKDMWHKIVYRDLTLPSVTVLRDFHSPNIIWLGDRQASQRIGLIDVQDALIGSPAYDLASLLQDARVDMDHVQEEIGLSRYCEWRRLSADVAAQFRDEYDILGVQRNLKIAGIFHRLNTRDGKPHYLNHLPRIEAYLARGLARPALAPLREWLVDYAPTWDWKSDEH